MEVIIGYYTFWVLAFSIIDITSKTDLSISTLVASVALFGLSIFLTTYKFNKIAEDYKHSYIQLNKLESDINNLIRILSIKRGNESSNLLYSNLVNDLELRYSEILEKTENHKDVDHIRVQLYHGNQVDFKNHFKFLFLTYLLKPIFILLTFFLPICLLFYYWIGVG